MGQPREVVQKSKESRTKDEQLPARLSHRSSSSKDQQHCSYKGTEHEEKIHNLPPFTKTAVGDAYDCGSRSS